MNARRRIPLFSTVLCLCCPIAQAAVQACLAPPAGAVYWLGAERNFDDLAGYHNGNDAGTGVTFVAGKVGAAIHVDGNLMKVYPDVTYAEERALRTEFTIEFWAKPSTEAPSGCLFEGPSVCGGNMPWVVFPEHGANSAPPGEESLAAGIGVAVGINGICVGQHTAFQLWCLAVYQPPTAFADWTHVAVVVTDKTPHLYINGVPVHTGLKSDYEFVFASWSVIGTYYSGMAGDLDELTVYDRALGDAEIAAIHAAGSDGKCRAECVAERTDDLWQGATVTAHTALESSDANGMFGGTTSSPEPTSTLFLDNQGDGFTHSVTWQIAAPQTLGRLGIAAFQDSKDTTQRAFRHVHIEARELGGTFAPIYDSDVLVPYGQGAQQRDLLRCPRIRPVHAQEFRAEFVQQGAGLAWGPRVLELDGMIEDPIFADDFD
jgi:hypothetical protein